MGPRFAAYQAEAVGWPRSGGQRVAQQLHGLAVETLANSLLTFVA
jgi:hypothetical protein